MWGEAGLDDSSFDQTMLMTCGSVGSKTFMADLLPSTWLNCHSIITHLCMTLSSIEEGRGKSIHPMLSVHNTSSPGRNKGGGGVGGEDPSHHLLSVHHTQGMKGCDR